MGCYGIGVSRVVAALIEVSHDEKGIIWPEAIYPFQVIIIDLLDDKELGLKLYNQLEALGVSVLYDDKKDSPGTKFSRADLIGITHQVILGKSCKDNQIEYRRRGSEKQLLDVPSLLKLLTQQ
jgi:prolyl-tRNA synthetase